MKAGVSVLPMFSPRPISQVGPTLEFKQLDIDADGGLLPQYDLVNKLFTVTEEGRPHYVYAERFSNSSPSDEFLEIKIGRRDAVAGPLINVEHANNGRFCLPFYGPSFLNNGDDISEVVARNVHMS